MRHKVCANLKPQGLGYSWLMYFLPADGAPLNRVSGSNNLPAVLEYYGNVLCVSERIWTSRGLGVKDRYFRFSLKKAQVIAFTAIAYGYGQNQDFARTPFKNALLEKTRTFVNEVALKLEGYSQIELEEVKEACDKYTKAIDKEVFDVGDLGEHYGWLDKSVAAIYNCSFLMRMDPKKLGSNVYSLLGSTIIYAGIKDMIGFEKHIIDTVLSKGEFRP